ncbi:MAG: helix-turn-helix domain-containing protein [Bacillota bacterium]|nr:helix-turn-helix domain-containing protein [Bacillota bacterium]
MGNAPDTPKQCPMSTAINILSGKWKISIVWYLSRRTTRFNELQRKLPNITQKTLTLQLRELEKDGIIKRKVYPEVPPKVEYSLTELGESIKPILKAMCSWGKKYKKVYDVYE